MLKASLKDITILDGYLHDSYFKPENIAFNEGQGCCTMDIERVCYERAKHGKVLFFIPVIRYPYICSHVIMTKVESMKQQWIDHGVDGPDDKQLLMDIEHKSSNIIVFGSTHFKVTLTVAPDFEFTLVDKPEPDNGLGKTIDFSKKGIFYGMDEVNKLRMEPIEKKFLSKGVIRGSGTLLLRPKDALSMVRRCRELGIRVLGIEGFRLTEKTTQPVMEESINLDELGRDRECWARAETFLIAHLNTDLFFEVVV